MGNMYPWIGKTWNPVAGVCPHDCSYCYVKALSRFPATRDKYQGKPRVHERSIGENLGEGNTIFVCSMFDLFAEEVNTKIIERVLAQTRKFPGNVYLFQSKNPGRMANYLDKMPPKAILGTTIETNRDYKVSKAPTPEERYQAMLVLKHAIKTMGKPYQLMVSVEPIMDFDSNVLSMWLRKINPQFVSFGADSKKNKLPEPDGEKVCALVNGVSKYTQIKIKKNLLRLGVEGCLQGVEF